MGRRRLDTTSVTSKPSYGYRRARHELYLLRRASRLREVRLRPRPEHRQYAPSASYRPRSVRSEPRARTARSLLSSLPVSQAGRASAALPTDNCRGQVRGSDVKGLSWALKFDTGEYLVLPHTATLQQAEKVRDSGTSPSSIVRVSFHETRAPARRA